VNSFVVALPPRSPLDAPRRVALAHVLEHHRRREDQRRRVGLALARDVRRAAVDGLEDGALVADVGAGHDAEAADEARAEVERMSP
jgi:hypothetical protein